MGGGGGGGGGGDGSIGDDIFKSDPFSSSNSGPAGDTNTTTGEIMTTLILQVI